MASGSDKKILNPFPGLRPFTTRESHLFFGRQYECEQVAGKLLMNRYITVIGESGAGKTSLILAGVIPALKELMKDQPEWKVFAFRPGREPFVNLAKTIESKMTSEELTAGIVLPDNPEGITGMFRDLHLKDGERIIIVIDQFEDLFINKNSAVAVRFVDSLVKTVAQTTLNIYIIVAMRAECISECSRFQGLTNLVNSSSFLVPPMNRENYRQVIEGPLRQVNTDAEPVLVNSILDGIGERIDLPVLQHALMRTWDKWNELDDIDKPISVNDYESAGSVRDAISIQGDEIYLELNQKGRNICERIFRTIVGDNHDRQSLSRPASVYELMQVTGGRFDEVCSVIEKFRASGRNFLIPDQDIVLTEDTVIDISHACLVRTWDRLKEWIEAEAASVTMYLKLSEASALYQQGKTRLLKQPDLQLALNWRNSEKPSLEWARRYDPAFERAMVYLRTSENQFRAEEESRHKQQKARFKRVKFLSAILGTATIIAAVFMIDAIIKKTDFATRATNAEKERMQEEQRRLAADSIVEDSERRRKLYQAAASEAEMKAVQTGEKLEAALTGSITNYVRRKSDSTLAGLNEVTRQRDDAMRLRMVSLGKTMSLRSIQEEKSDLQISLAYQAYIFNKRNNGYPNDADIYAGLYNIANKSGTPSCKSFNGTAERITGIAFIPGKKEFYTSGSDGRILKWNIDSPEKAVQVIYSGRDAEIIEVMALSPDSEWLACGSSNMNIRMIPLSQKTGSYVFQGHTGAIKSLVYSWDGRYLYSAAVDGKVLKWDIAARTSTDVTGAQKIISVDISSGGNFIAGISSDGKVLVWNPERQSDVFRIDAGEKEIRTVRFNPDNNILAIGDISGQVDFYDVLSRRKISSIKAHENAVDEIRFNPKLRQVATAGSDGKLKLFDFSDPAGIRYAPVTFREESFITIIQFSPDGHLMLTASGDGGLRLRPSNADYLAQDVSHLLTRNMSTEEWNMYIAPDIPLENPYPVKDFSIKVSEIKN